MMTSTLSTCTWLLLPCCVLVTLSTGELDFYRDDEPESADSITVRQLIKYLEGQRPRYSASLENLGQRKRDDRLKERDILEALLAKEILRKEKTKEWNHRQTQYNEPINELPREREHYFPFYELNPIESSLEYPNFKFPYFSRDQNGDDINYRVDGFEYGRDTPLKHLPYEERDFNKGMMEEPLLEYQGHYRSSVKQEDAESNNRMAQRPLEDIPDFTFKVDDSNLRERHPFAVKPNDPRYYQDTPFSLDDKDESDFAKEVKNRTKWEEESSRVEIMHPVREQKTRDIESKLKDASVILVPELERHIDYKPLYVPVNQDLNNDMYFIAIVAGCSATAMFALVLIALTWCRLKKGAKAAADIEYPAYGVTGPNKEVSPSGDQRLAQSAQMYHFQHQKQQIIAMEKDPGSVSEAESEEENEEGDYTVYECPGLASTGELEVKNPLFHDDPTPATPAQTNKEEDHI